MNYQKYMFVRGAWYGVHRSSRGVAGHPNGVTRSYISTHRFMVMMMVMEVMIMLVMMAESKSEAETVTMLEFTLLEAQTSRRVCAPCSCHRGPPNCLPHRGPPLDLPRKRTRPVRRMVGYGL